MPKSANSSGQKFIVIKHFEVSDLWTIYEICKQQQDQSSTTATTSSFSGLQIPILILLYQLVNCDDEINSSGSIGNNNKPTHTYDSIFKSLCYIIDESAFENEIIKKITKEILRNGLMVFFPDEPAREKVFLQMIQANPATTEGQNNQFSFSLESTHIIFEAFCRLFAANKALLVNHSFDSWEACANTLTLVDTLISFCFFLGDASDTSSPKLLNPLNDLLNSIQSNVFFKVQQKLGATDLARDNVQRFILQYAALVINKCNQVTRSLMTDKRKQAPNNNKAKLKTYLNKIVYNFILWLSEVFTDLDASTSTRFGNSVNKYQLIQDHINLIAHILKKFSHLKLMNFHFFFQTTRKKT